MRKLSLSVIGFYLGLLASFAQDSTAYKSRKLHLDEINFVSGYYKQDGVHSAVTGGIGTEALTDIANNIELKLSHYNKKGLKHQYSLEVGVDHYSSASSDKIDPYTISSASAEDTRYYPSVGWSLQDEERRRTVGLSASYSYEYDYRSLGFGAFYTKASKDNNREFTARGQVYLDQWSVILPIELRPTMGGGGGDDDDHHDDYPSSPRNTYTASFSLAQVVNRNLQLMVLTEPTYQEGLLATKYQRVYFKDGMVVSENLPDQRFKIPIGIRANYFAGDRAILRSFYRFYTDNWGVRAHTLELEVPYKVTPFFSLTPMYRFYTQTAAEQFAGYQQHTHAATYFTSDYDLSKFNSHYFGAGLRLAPPKGVLNLSQFNSIELRYGHYTRNDGLRADQLSLHLKWKRE